MVSPAEKGAYDFAPNYVIPSASGNQVIVSGGAANATLSTGLSLMLETRGEHGWEGVPLDPSPTGGADKEVQDNTALVGVGEEDDAFSRFAYNTGIGLEEQRDQEGLDVYVRDGAAGPFAWVSGPPAPTLKNEPCPKYEEAHSTSFFDCDALFAGASKNLGDVVWSQAAPLVDPPAVLPGQPADTHTAGDEVYESMEGAGDQLVGQVPASATESQCGSGSASCVVPPCGAAMRGTHPGELEASGSPIDGADRGAVSGDGSQVVFTSPDPKAHCGPPPELYVRENGSRTVEVSASQRTVPDPKGSEPKAFVGSTEANGKLTTVFFTSHQELTNDANTGYNVQEVLISGADGGTFELTFEEQRTTAIPYGASAKEVQEALEALPAIGDNNVEVTRGATANRYLVTFEGALAGSEQPPMSIRSLLLEITVGSVNIGVQIPGNDLYAYDLQTGKLTDLTASSDPENPGGANVSHFIGSSNDGSLVYFTATGVLTETPNSQGAAAQPGVINLYVYDAETGHTTFIAPGAKMGGAGGSALGYSLKYSVTPDGQHLVFVDSESLTGYDNVGPCGEGCSEVYLYDATSNTLGCVSCDPTGAAPVGNASLAEGSEYRSPFATEVSPSLTMSDDASRVFFTSPDRLTPEAPLPTVSRGVEALDHGEEFEPNVYESENGQVHLIAPAATLEATTASGNDVFFDTMAQLVPQDRDGYLDIYDARVNGGFPTVAPPACAGTACQGDPAPAPIFSTPSSVTFNGVGNFPQPSTSSPPAVVKPKAKTKPAKCKRGFTKKKSKCIKTRKNAKKSTHHKGSH
jgi:hypothetical protein